MRRVLIVAFGALLALVLWAGIATWRAAGRPAQDAPPAASNAVATPAPAPAAEPDPAEPGTAQSAPDAGAALDAEAPAFASIDLEAAREALPDNLYWETAAPTSDPRLLGDRERAKVHWNDQYGKILSGTGTEEEIRAFYDHRMRLSSDSVRFVDWVLEHQGDSLSEQDLELLHVAKRLHLARLAEVPRRMQEALDRKVQQDAAREAWLAAEREFAGEGEADSESEPADPDANAVP